MEYYKHGRSNAAQTTAFPQRCQYGYDVFTEDSVPTATDGCCVYGVSEVTRDDNGDVIATVSDTTGDDRAVYPFIV